MTFSLDLTKPLGRLGYLVNLAFLGVACSAFVWLAHALMTETFPASHAQHEAEVAAQTTYADGVAKAKKAAKGAALSAEQTAKLKEEATEAGKKKGEEALEHGRETWAPFQVFLLILGTVFLGGFASVAVQRRMNDAGLQGMLWLAAGHVGTWALAAYVAFLPYLDAAGLAKTWGLVPAVAAFVILPIVFASTDHSAEHEGH